MSEGKRIPGRASSQVSIYNYPEHLNPFYEDENHKRLRFWKINSNSSKGQKTGRSNSFSLSGLKDIWALKSFRLKKKSSTLGINKTSESPPELRRVHPVTDTYNTVDSRSRHTYDIGLGSNFQRSGHRSSLQNVHSSGDSNGFYRNDRYRSTIQNGSQTLATTSGQRDRYTYSGSNTPTATPRSRFAQSRHGSSQTSINSTNPFEDDDDNVSRCESIDGVSLRKRKKRKAPQPPVAANANQQACPTVEESPGKEEDMVGISNLTAEIETFVRTHDTDQAKLRETDEKPSPKEKIAPIPPPRTISVNQIASPKGTSASDNAIALNHTTVTIEPVPIQTVVNESNDNNNNNNNDNRSTEVTVEVHQQLTSNVSENENRTLCERKFNRSRESPENNEDYPERTSQTPDPDAHSEQVKMRKFSSVKQLNVTDSADLEPSSETAPKIIVQSDDKSQAIIENGKESPVSPVNNNNVESVSEPKIIAAVSSAEKPDSKVVVIESITTKTATSPAITVIETTTTNVTANAKETRESEVTTIKSTTTTTSTSPAVTVIETTTTNATANAQQGDPEVAVVESATTKTARIPAETVTETTTTNVILNGHKQEPDVTVIETITVSTVPAAVKCDSEIVSVKTIQNEPSSSPKDPKEKPKIPPKKNFKNSLEKYSTKSDRFTVESAPDAVPELKIVESTDDLTATSGSVSQSSDRYKIRFVALKNFSPEPQRRDIEPPSHNDQEFDVEDIDLPPAPPQRRRSVRDIIASINKSQSLLKVNQKPSENDEPKRTYNYEPYTPTTPIRSSLKSSQQPTNPSDESINRKYSELEESERKMRKMITEMEESTNPVDVPVPVVEKFDDFAVDGAESNDLFKKCVVRRDKSLLQSGASQDENNRSSMEWNPLPKPRRSRNLTHELENGKI